MDPIVANAYVAPPLRLAATWTYRDEGARQRQPNPSDYCDSAPMGLVEDGAVGLAGISRVAPPC